MTAFQQKSFSVAQSGRSPDSCGHGWIDADHRCVFCGSLIAATPSEETD